MNWAAFLTELEFSFVYRCMCTLVDVSFVKGLKFSFFASGTCSNLSSFLCTVCTVGHICTRISTVLWIKVACNFRALAIFWHLGCWLHHWKADLQTFVTCSSKRRPLAKISFVHFSLELISNNFWFCKMF